MHRYGFIHKDIKPANVFLSEQEDIKLGDLGTSREIETSQSAATNMGTKNYKAPEQWMEDFKRSTGKVDIWGVGCILYELITLKGLIE